MELKQGQSVYPIHFLHADIISKDDKEFGIVEFDCKVKKRDGGTYRKTVKTFVEPEFARKYEDVEYKSCYGVFELVDPVNPCRLIDLVFQEEK